MGGFQGHTCAKRTCPEACNSRGTCTEDGQCVCDRGFTGKTCAEASGEAQLCPNQCSNAGRCDVDTGMCKCDVGFGNLDCSQRVCPVDTLNGNMCSGHGK